MVKTDVKRPKVLVVDDERLIRWTLTEALRGWDYTPIEAADAATALALFEAERPDAVLLDTKLPDRSGLDALWRSAEESGQAAWSDTRPSALSAEEIGKPTSRKSPRAPELRSERDDEEKELPGDSGRVRALFERANLILAPSLRSTPTRCGQREVYPNGRPYR